MDNIPIIIAGSRLWNRIQIEGMIDELPMPVCGVSNRSELDKALSEEPGIRFIFFLHWSFTVPKRITENYHCICFHMTNVPYGRGGSPLQNLIQRGHRETILSALKMVTEVDAGPVYLKRPLSLEGGTAEEIYIRAAELSCEMIQEILERNLQPIAQEGEVVEFKRRKSENSVLPVDAPLDVIHDHIRMLDAEGYPHAFLEVGGIRLEFTRSARYAENLLADVRITRKLD